MLIDYSSTEPQARAHRYCSDQTMLGGRSSSCRAVASVAILLCFGVVAARPAPEAARAAANGTCQTRVVPFGYKCEEHTVRNGEYYPYRSDRR